MNNSIYLEEKHAIKHWCSAQKINYGVVGWSGGIDSATTTRLFLEAGIHTCAVVATAPNQTYSSSYGGKFGCEKFKNEIPTKTRELLTIREIEYIHLFKDECENEAAAPIIRTAIFYGVCAKLRKEGFSPLVVGTVNFSEASFLGFAGLKSDMNCDFYPISHLSKAEVYDLARRLNVSQEIIEAVPSGDLLFTDTNDHKMIGATYEQIQTLIDRAETPPDDFSPWIMDAILAVDDPKLFCENIVRNAFKYDLPFGGFHLKSRLEDFRQKCYLGVLSEARIILKEYGNKL